MSLKIVSLASGSKGNATLVCSDSTAILVDAGASFTYLSKQLKMLGLMPNMLDGVVITHEHSDHIRAVDNFAKHTKIYAHSLTAERMLKKVDCKNNLVKNDDYEQGFKIGNIDVIPFRTPHDAVYSLGYSFECGAGRVSVATDMGVPTRGLLKNIADSQIVLLEANYDIEMLENGPYPYYLQARIQSDKGHLSNDSTARIAELLVGSKVETIILAHLSDKNNTADKAISTVFDRLKKSKDNQIHLSIATQMERSEIFDTY